MRQVLERGFPVTEVAQRLRMSAHSLYNWIKAVKSNKTDQLATELAENRSEIALKSYGIWAVPWRTREQAQELLVS